ncbi:hypothetical protein EJF18_60337 [Clavispora lusitaniae]|uniref:Uncharacterized protein n=1 Tax=Clavispora lusitaniae TaxID=36911 RepID=A0ACD0WQM9_CLALS|nr:hypothetical protein EJF14_60337 [Clavispora lusitaniae]QFZ35474.1 hypothetical protein EJF16_60337 [Clavispora lusitaniae]QFZ41168.1 hypothetical protein EJF15_60337 [Clavispora lusitaniae]QFZ46849.1 hypothetical protein EJF18_60337 [Clavispora lusitaniae]QFZ52514.1 hypothetical protein EJF17_60337 [Clavispora lusitaniae]
MPDGKSLVKMPDGILVKISIRSTNNNHFQYVPSRSSLFQYSPDVIHWPETKPNCLRAQRVKLAGTRRKIRRGSPRSRSPPLGERKKSAFCCWEPDIYCRLFRICPFLSTCPRPRSRVSSFPTLFYRTFAAMTTVIKSIEKMKPRGGDNWVRTLDYDYLERNYNIHKYYPQFIHNTDISTPELRAELSDKPIYAQASKLAKAKGATEKAPHNRKGQNKKQNDKHTQNQNDKHTQKQNNKQNTQIQNQNHTLVQAPIQFNEKYTEPAAAVFQVAPPRSRQNSVRPVEKFPRTSFSDRLKLMIRPRNNQMERTRSFDQTQATMTSARHTTIEARRMSDPTSTYPIC